MAVIVDNQNEMVSRIVMIDDGRGLSVHIPSVLIPKDDGEKIIEFARDQKVNGIMLFNVTRKEEKANVTFGLNIENRQSFKLMRDFEPYLEQFQKENKSKSVCQSLRSQLRHLLPAEDLSGMH